MKKFITTTIGLIAALLMISASCKNSKGAEVSPATPVVETMVRAIVTTDYVKEGCEALLKMTVDGEERLFMPISLNDEFKVNNLEVLVEYTLSRIVQTDCLKGAPVNVTKIKKVK